MYSVILITFLLLVGLVGPCYLLIFRVRGRYAILGACLMAVQAFALFGVQMEAPAASYYVPAIGMPVLWFLLFFRKRPLPLAAFYALDVSALLVLVYAFTLGMQFHNYYMGRPPLHDYPSLVISQAWGSVFLYLVLPLNAMVLAAYPIMLIIARRVPGSKRLALPWNWRVLGVAGGVVAAGALLYLSA